MITANISKTKNELSRYLEAVRGGDTVLILDRNRPIARIQPLAGGMGCDSARFLELEASGAVTRPEKATRGWVQALETPPVGANGYVESVEALVEERESGR
jgi:prevent-host-death family protein